MTPDLWSQVDAFIGETVAASDAALDAALQASADAGLPAIQVTANQGKLLQLLARLMNARTILEIGTLGGYSTIWLARALPAGGRLLSLEVEPRHVEVAHANLARSGLSGVAEVRLGRALDVLPQLAGEGWAPFDFVFIDADKASCPEYFDWAHRLSRVGALIIVDNVVRNGALVDRATTDPNNQGVQRLHEMLRDRPGVSATTIQTVGGKGYDGLLFALVTGK